MVTKMFLSDIVQDWYWVSCNGLQWVWEALMQVPANLCGGVEGPLALLYRLMIGVI